MINRWSIVRIGWPSVAVAVLSSFLGSGRHDQTLFSRVIARDFELPGELQMVKASVAKGATFASLLQGHGIRAEDIASAVARAASVFDVRKLRAARPYRLAAANGELRRLDYEIDGDRLLRLKRDGNAFSADIELIPKTRSVAVVKGVISRDTPSLSSAIEGAGESIDLALSLAEVFGGEIDFNTELQPGDRFEVLVEKQYRENDRTFAGYGSIVVARFENGGRHLGAVRFVPEGGSAGYFDERGVSMRRFFLRSPLKFDPIVTSAFSLHRLHPVLGEVRAHLGVDYRAPEGAPVAAVADGVVVSAGWSGGAGRMLHLRHANGYETEYLHLSTIAVHDGQRVRQGELIGRVGATGLATGPHLDYRLKHDGVFINPVAAGRLMPPADPVPPSQMTAFREIRDQVFGQLQTPAAAASAAPQ
jgi:murein DD-endopeptidase MepM/ murein hydrolase activator NlpD